MSDFLQFLNGSFFFFFTLFPHFSDSLPLQVSVLSQARFGLSLPYSGSTCASTKRPPVLALEAETLLRWQMTWWELEAVGCGCWRF